MIILYDRCTRIILRPSPHSIRWFLVDWTPDQSDQLDVLLTLLIWVPLNAAMEQLLWVYIFDAFETRWTEKRKRFLGGVVGMLLAVIFVGLIHVIFWTKFLPSFESIMPWSQLFLIAQFVITPGYLLLYRRTGSMWPIFVIHIISDAVLVLSAMYSIGSQLWTL
jgi:hypothetical protein